MLFNFNYKNKLFIFDNICEKLIKKYKNIILKFIKYKIDNNNLKKQ